MSTEQERKQKRLAAVAKAKKLSISSKLIDLGVHLSDSLGVLNQTEWNASGVGSSKEWREMLDSIGQTWTKYEELTGGFTIDDATACSIAELLDD